MSNIHFPHFHSPQKLKRENKATKVLTLKVSWVFVFLLPNQTITYYNIAVIGDYTMQALYSFFILK